MIDKAREPVRKRELLAILGASSTWLGQGQGRGAKDHEIIDKVILAALLDPQTRAAGHRRSSRLAATPATTMCSSRSRGTRNFRRKIGSRPSRRWERSMVRPSTSWTDLIAATNGKPSSSPIANAAVRTVPHIYDARTKLTELVTARKLSPGTEARGPERLCRASGWRPADHRASPRRQAGG